MADQWYILRDGKRHGPYTGADLKKHAATGHLLPIDLVVKDGMAKPVPAGKVKGLFPPAEPRRKPAPDEIAAATEQARPAPRREPGRPNRTKLYLVLGGGGLLSVIVVIAVVLMASGRKPTTATGPDVAKSGGDTSSPGRAGAGGKSNPSADIKIDLPDFSQVDYKLDTSKLNYEQGPNGEKLTVEKSNSKDGPEIVTGYKDRTGEFIDHGLWAGKTLDGNPRFEIEVYRGKPHGKSTEFYPDGKVREQGLMKDGEAHGKRVEFYENGEKKSEWFYLSGKAHGPYTGWFQSGKKKTELTYVNGEKHGPHTEWNENGNKAVSTPYKNGKLHGTLTTWDDRGKEIVSIRFQDGQPDFKTSSEKRETFGMVIDLLKAGGAADKLEDWLQAFGRPDTGFNEAGIPKASNQPPSRQTWVYNCRDGRKELQVRISVGLGTLSRDQKGKAKFNGVTVVIIDRMRDL